MVGSWLSSTRASVILSFQSLIPQNLVVCVEVGKINPHQRNLQDTPTSPDKGWGGQTAPARGAQNISPRDEIHHPAHPPVYAALGKASQVLFIKNMGQVIITGQHNSPLGPLVPWTGASLGQVQIQLQLQIHQEHWRICR